LGIKAYTKKLEKAGFTVDTNYVYSDSVPRGGFVGWSASSGSRVPQYSTIYKLYSQGRDPEKVAAEKAAKKAAEKK
jgi:beta-lactam-binding protein with PASTA domain